jgi:ribA/ribD-fused uncharacterized protein
LEIIDSFKNEHNWLSNFFKSPITIDGITYPTIEHAFQAAKTDVIEEKLKIVANANPVIAKRIGKKVQLRENWDELRVEIMRKLIDLKFQDEVLAEKLIATGDATLVEGNHWHDNYWGACSCAKCSGKTQSNNLGLLLMEKREKLKQSV